MTLQAGRLRHRVQIQEYANVLDSDGDVIQDPNTGEVARIWSLWKEVWAAIEPLSTREFIQSQATQSEVSARIIIRELPGINAAMRIVHTPIGRSSVIYDIHGILRDKETGLEYITMPVSEGVSDSGL